MASMKAVLRAGTCLIIVWCLSVAFVSLAYAAPVDTATLIRNIQDIYAGVDSFQAQFVQELTHQESAVTETRRGTFLFQKPMLVRWETEAPTPELLLVTNQEVWNYLEDEDLAYRYSLDMVQDSRSIIVVITGQSPLDQEFDVEALPATPEDNGLIHLLLYPKDPAPQLTEAHIWVEPGTFLIKQAMVMDFYGNTNKIMLESMVPGARASDADFLFTPPPGTEVEDHREDVGVSWQ